MLTVLENNQLSLEEVKSLSSEAISKLSLEQISDLVNKHYASAHVEHIYALNGEELDVVTIETPWGSGNEFFVFKDGNRYVIAYSYEHCKNVHIEYDDVFTFQTLSGIEEYNETYR